MRMSVACAMRQTMDVVFTLPPRRSPGAAAMWPLRWSTDGKFIATGTQENDIHVWRMAQATDMRMQAIPPR